MKDMAANIIAWGTVIVTVGFCVWFGIRAARRNKKYPRKIEYLEDGFAYHGMFGDTRVRWRDIMSVEVKQETHRSGGGKYGRGRTSKIWVLDIAAGRKSFNIFTDDFENVSFDEFVAMLEQHVRGSNPRFRGVGGDVDKFRKEITPPEPEADAEAEAEEKEFDRRFEARLAALGRPATTKERIAIVKELQRELKKERRMKKSAE